MTAEAAARRGDSCFGKDGGPEPKSGVLAKAMPKKYGTIDPRRTCA